MFTDSIFSPILTQFQQNDEEIPYADDEPILGRKEITDALDNIEDRFSNLLTNLAWSETDKYLKELEPALQKADRSSVEKEKWAIAVPMQGLLYGLWTESWGLGESHAVKELNLVYAKNAEKEKGKGKEEKGKDSSSFFFRFPFSSFLRSEFTKRDDPVYIAYPPDYGIPLSASDLREAVEQRTLKLANDVSDSSAARIQSYILDAVDKHKPEGGVPPKERKLLVRRINGILGRQAGLEADRDIPPEERVKTTVRVPGTNAFHKRARLIATTELSAAYSLGRLQVYTQAGVKKVRWQAIGDLRTCPLCRSRNGTIHNLDSLLAQQQFANRGIYDPRQYVIPCHPGDRCHWAAVLDDVDNEDNKRSQDSGRDPTLRKIAQLRQGWSLAGTVINIASAVTGVVQRQQQEAERERARTQRIQRTLFLGGAAALSLAALYMLLSQQQKRGEGVGSASVQGLVQPERSRAEEVIAQTASELQRRQRQQQTESQPVRPEQVLTPELQQRYQRLAQSGIDLRATTNVGLQANYGVRPQDVALIRELIRQYQQRQAIPPERSLVPQNLLPQNILQQYPQLQSVPDVRNLSVEDLVRLGVSQSQAPRLQQIIQQSIRDQLALPPASISQVEGLIVGGVDLNSASPQQIAALLNRIPKKNRAEVAQRVWEFLQRRQLQGQPVFDLQELLQVEGVGQVTVRNLASRNYTTNLNNLLLQVSDSAASEIIAGQLEVGPKLASEIVKEFRQSGQFGRTGVDPVEDLINRLQSRVNKKGSKVTLSPDAIARIRERLAGRVYTIPTPAVQPQIQQVGRRQVEVGSGGITIPSLTPAATPPAPLPPTPAPPSPPATSSLPTSDFRPPTSLVRPIRYQPPITRDGSIVVGSQEMRQQENRDRIMRGVRAVEQQVSDYQSRLTSVVQNSKTPAAGRRASPKLGTQIQNAAVKQQDAARKTTGARARINSFTSQSQNVLPELEQSVARIEELLQDLGDPLADPYFNNVGNLSAGVNKRIAVAVNDIDNTLAEMAYTLNSPERETVKLNALIEELRSLRSRSASLLEDAALPPNSALALERSQALQNIQRQLDDLTAARAVDVGDGFIGSIEQMRDRFSTLLRSQADLAQSDVIARINGQIAAVENSIARLSRSNNAGALSTLTETRERLVDLRDRVNNLPRRVDQLTPEQQAQWRTTQATRRRIQESSTNLKRSLQNYRDRIRGQVEQIRAQSEQFTSIAQDLEVVQDDGLTLYQQERRSAIASNQNLIIENLTTLDNNLNQLRMVADPSVGIRYVMQNIPEALEDVTPDVTGGLSATRRQMPKGLDEAAETRRAAINTLRSRLDYEPPEGKSNFGDINRVERILDYDSPGRVTRTRIDKVEQQIAQWEALRSGTAANTSRYAAAVRADLEALRQADPVAYAEINPQKILREIEYNAAFQARGFEQRIQRLQRLREQLRQDLTTPVSYQTRPDQSVTVPQLRQQLSNTRNEVQSLGRTRRAELDAVWSKVVNSGADADAIARRVKENRGRRSSGIQGSYLTANQKQLLSGLTDEQWQTLQDSVESGAFDLYKELGRLSGQKRRWDQLAASKWQEIQDSLRELEQKYGYRLIVRQEPDGSLSYVSRLKEKTTGMLNIEDLEDIETNPDRFRRGGRNPSNLLARIRLLTGIGSRTPVNLDNPRNYVDAQAALLKNQDQRQAIDRRLEILNFSQRLRLAEFRNKSKLLRAIK